MTLDEIVVVSDSFTDESATAQMKMGFGNTAIAIINTKLGLMLPRITGAKEDYKALPWSWFQRILTPYISYGVKMNDGSLNEAQFYKEEFEQALFDLKSDINNVFVEGSEFEQYLDPSVHEGRITKLDPSNNIPSYMGNW